jgi:hypothetical protein
MVMAAVVVAWLAPLPAAMASVVPVPAATAGVSIPPVVTAPVASTGAGDSAGSATIRLPRSRPTLAVEDTLRQSAAEPLPEILVTAPRQTIDEILRRVAEGEARRDSLLQDQAFTLLLRFSGRHAANDPTEKSELYAESAERVYQKRPHRQRVVTLKEWSRESEKRKKNGQKGGEPSVKVSFDADMSESFIGFAFDPNLRGRYQFRIVDRALVGDQVVYQLSFTPRSALEPLPAGRVWVNTNDFVILREEFRYTDRSPLPLFIQSIDSCVLERTLIDHRYWVVSRIIARVTLTDPVLWMGRLGGGGLPKVADLAIARTDWIINGGIPDSLFAPADGGGAK